MQPKVDNRNPASSRVLSFLKRGTTTGTPAAGEAARGSRPGRERRRCRIVTIRLKAWTAGFRRNPLLTPQAARSSKNRKLPRRQRRLGAQKFSLYNMMLEATSGDPPGIGRARRNRGKNRASGLSSGRHSASRESRKRVRDLPTEGSRVRDESVSSAPHLVARKCQERCAGGGACVWSTHLRWAEELSEKLSFVVTYRQKGGRFDVDNNIPPLRENALFVDIQGLSTKTSRPRCDIYRRL